MKLKTPMGGELDVLRALYENQSAWDARHALPHKILGIGMGGGFCCIRVAAIFEALAEAGLTHPFTALITVSGSGGPAGAYLSGCAHRAAGLFEHLAVTGFVTWDPWWNQYRLDLEKLERALLGDVAPFGLEQEKILRHPTTFWVTAAREDGQKEILNAKTVAPHAARAVCASSAVPGMCEPIIINGVPLVDGAGGGNALPVDDGLSVLSCAQGEKPKVLVMQARIHPKYRPIEWMTWPWVARAMLMRKSPQLRENIALIDSCFAGVAEKLSLMRGVEWCRIAPTLEDTEIYPFTTSLSLLSSVRRETRAFMRWALKDAKPARQI